MSKVCTKHDKRRYTGGIKDSISDNNKVWDGTPEETTRNTLPEIQIEFLALEFPLDLFELSYRYEIDIPWL